MITSKFSFIQFFPDLEDCGCESLLPVASLSDLSFNVLNYLGGTKSYSLTTISGDVIGTIGSVTTSWYNPTRDISELLACGDCFRIILVSQGDTWYSNVFRYDQDESNTVLVRYWCDEPQFGFEYDGYGANSIRLPATLRNPNNTKDKSIYTDGNGVRRTLYCELRKQYGFVTDFLPDHIHDKISILFAHDHVEIDDIEIDEEGTYTVDWEGADETGCIPLAKGETTVVEMEIHRNNNC